MRRSFCLVGMLVVLAACHSSSSTGPSDAFVGHWVGADANITLDLTISGKASALGGSGSLSGSGGAIGLTLSGSDDGSLCHLVLSSGGYQPVYFRATLGGDSLHAILDSSGFVEYAIGLAHQR